MRGGSVNRAKRDCGDAVACRTAFGNGAAAPSFLKLANLASKQTFSSDYLNRQSSVSRTTDEADC